MRFYQFVLSGAALIAAVGALEFNQVPTEIEAGETYTITYSPKDDIPTQIKLRKGDPDDLDEGTVLTASATGGEYEWSVPSELENADDYALEIIRGEENNYSGQITLTGGSDEEDDDEPSSSASSATPSATMMSSSASMSSSMAETTMMTSPMTTASISASASSSVGSNTTITTGSPSGTASETSGPSATQSDSAPEEATGAASSFASKPMAAVFGAAAAMAYLA